MKTNILLLAWILLLAFGPLSIVAGDETAPFPDALDAAAISVPSLDSILEYALVVGNGDINALLYAPRGNLAMVLTKNDVWDARLDSRLDPPIPTIKRVHELARGDWPNRGQILPKGSTWKAPDSYHAHPYPCPRACAKLILGDNPSKPQWRRIRAEGRENSWRYDKGVAVMTIAGAREASNGWACGPLDCSTDDYPKLRLKISGSENARFYIDVMDPAGRVVFASKWTETPTEPETRTFDLPPGQPIGQLILYTWTEDGKPAENRFESLAFESEQRSSPVDLKSAAPMRTPARLDLRRAVARVAGATDGPPAATARALAQQNVFLVESDAPARLEAFDSAETPPAETGVTSGVRWLKQNLPGDLDWPGMHFSVALAEAGGRKAVAIVTSRESSDTTADAVKLARSTVRTEMSTLIAEHEKAWRRFWSASGVDMADGVLSRAWYQGLYFLRCVSKPGVIAPGLFASLIDDKPAWHGDYHTNYNIQQTFWGCYAANHAELAEPYDRLITEYLPRARWLAREVYATDGAYFPHVLFAYEPSDPEKCKSPVGRQYIHHVWGFTIGVAGFTVQPLWWHYKYDPNREFLERVAYPAVRDVALFYADFVDRCERKGDRVVLAPSVSPEHWGWTPNFEKNRNCAFDIGMARYILEAAIEGAETLGRDRQSVARFKKALAVLPAYPTTKSEPPIVVDVEDAPPITYNIAVPATPVFPCDVITWRSPKETRELFTRTIESLRWNGNNSTVILGVARARLGMVGTIDWIRREIEVRHRPNATLTLNRLKPHHGFNDFGHYTEQFGVTMAVSELLLQSVGDVIRIFPAWPKEKDARFRNLRAQGGFLVSAGLKDGKVGPIEIASTAGGKLRLHTPGKRLLLQLPGSPKTVTLAPDRDGVVEIDTRRGQRLVLQPCREK